MAAALKDSFPLEIARDLAAAVKRHEPSFPSAIFLEQVGEDWERLELMGRGERIATGLWACARLPYPRLLEILVEELGPELERTEGNGMAPFRHLPLSFLVARHGLDHLEESLEAMHALTRRFTAEFCIRPYLERHREAVLARLGEWARDPSPHVRRLVSEGTRPRLPWASRLREFQRDPSLALPLLEMLRDDPHPYVRRSVANHLNDIGKDHPEVLLEVARAWWRDGPPERRRLLEHALRVRIKQGDPGVLALLGYAATDSVSIGKGWFDPKSVRVGDSIEVSFEVRNTSASRQEVLVDLRLHAVKADGTLKPKVFKMRRVALGPGEAERLSLALSFRRMTTRTHHPGRHEVDALLNGTPHPLGSFLVRA
jgi:3-methyladenine DNA glycosylase AlkC